MCKEHWQRLSMILTQVDPGSFKIASSAALYHDHDYLPLRLDDQLVWENIKVTEEEVKAIEVKTGKQRDCKEWYLQRSLRVTASRVHEICHFTDRRDKETYARELVKGRPSVQTKAMLYGIAKEKHAKKVYSEVTGNDVVECGLFVSKEYPFLGASPDGLVARVSLLEVKCPESIKDEAISPSNYKHIELVGGKLMLKRDTCYYYQVQAQLLVTGRENCHFFVWTSVDSCAIWGKRDEGVMKDIISKVKNFYQKYIVPELRQKWFPAF